MLGQGQARQEEDLERPHHALHVARLNTRGRSGIHTVQQPVQELGATAFSGLGFVPTINVYSTTVGVTIKPLPKDPIGKNLSIRPEVRYDFSEDEIFSAGNDSFKDQLTFGADIIFKF